MIPRLSKAEHQLLHSFLICSNTYVEFGAGGSTCMAAALVRQAITSIDSSKEWLDSVAAFCAKNPNLIQPNLIHVDIGPVGEWGMPTDPETKSRWPDYHSKIWEFSSSHNADFFLGGR